MTRHPVHDAVYAFIFFDILIRFVVDEERGDITNAVLDVP